MLKSGKLKLADDMIVTAQEAANKVETVFTIYDDATNTEIAKGPIGGGGGGDGDIILNYEFQDDEDAKIEPLTALIKTYDVETTDNIIILWGIVVQVTFKQQPPETVEVNAYIDENTPIAGGTATVTDSSAIVVLQTTNEGAEVTQGDHDIKIVLGDK